MSDIIRRIKARDRDGDVIEIRGDRQDDAYYFTIRPAYGTATSSGSFTREEVEEFVGSILIELDGPPNVPEFVVDKKLGR